MVNTKDQNNAIVYCVWYLFCQHCWYEDQSMQCIECYVCQDFQYTVLVFVALTQHCIQSTMRCENSTLLCIKWPLTPPREKATVLCLLSCRFSCSPVWGGSFLTFLDLSTTRVIAGKTHSQSPILKTKGALSNPVIFTYLQTKLHPPYPNQTTYLVFEFWSKKCLQCLKNVGLYNSFGGGRFSFWQIWFTQASRFANS